MHIKDSLAMSTGMSTPFTHKHMAKETTVSGKSGDNDKGTAGSMGVSAGVGPAARVGSANAASTAEIDGLSVVSIEAAAGGSSEPELTSATDLDCCGSRSISVGAESPSLALPR